MQDSEENLKERIAQLENELRELTDDETASPDTSYADGLERFLAANSFAVVRATVSGEFLEVNDAFVDLLGYTQEEIASGKVRWPDITPPEFARFDAIAVEQLKSKGVADPFEKEYIAKDGRRVPVLLSIVAADAEGKDCFAFVADLSEQKKREAAVAQSESQFRTLTEAIPQVIFVATPDGQVIHFNQHWSDITGIERSAGYQNRWVETMLPEDIEPVLKVWDAARAEGKVFETETRYLRKDGQYRFCLVRALPLRDEEGKITRWFGTSTDIHEQREAEQRVRDSEAKFRTLADAIPQIVWTADPAGNIDFFNHRWTEYTGLSIEQSLNGGWKLLIHPDDLEPYLEAWTKALETGNTYEATFRLKRALGIKKDPANPYRRHLVRAVPLRGKEDRPILKWFATWTEIGRNSNLEME